MNTINSGGSLPDPDKIQRAYHMANSLTNMRKQKMIGLLEEDGDMTADDVSSKMQLNNRTTTNHLSALRRLDLVHTKKVDKKIFYILNMPRWESVRTALKRFCM